MPPAPTTAASGTITTTQRNRFLLGPLRHGDRLRKLTIVARSTTASGTIAQTAVTLRVAAVDPAQYVDTDAAFDAIPDLIVPAAAIPAVPYSHTNATPVWVVDIDVPIDYHAPAGSTRIVVDLVSFGIAYEVALFADISHARSPLA